MNLHTFKDVTNLKKSSLVNDLDEGDEEKEVGVLKKPVDGEEDNGDDKFNEAGEVLEPFNLRDERDSGHFDENMNFVFQKEKGEIDAWLADMDEAAMEKGIGEAAKALRIRQQKILDAEAAAKAKVKRSKMELKVLLLEMMRPGENVVQTMRRLSGKQSVLNKAKKRMPKTTNGTTAAPAESESQAQKQENKLALNRFSDLADELLSSGLSGIYDMSYEAIKNSSVRWEYRGLDGVLHGPFPPQVIVGWRAQGYFTGPSAVMMRSVGTVGKDWETDTGINVSNGNSSSEAGSSSATAKVRFNFDSDPANEPAAKKAKTPSAVADNASAEDLMNDLEEDDGDGAVKENVEVQSAEIVMTESVSKVEDSSRGEWMSSDDIEFEITVETEGDAQEDEVDVDDDEDDI